MGLEHARPVVVGLIVASALLFPAVATSAPLTFDAQTPLPEGAIAVAQRGSFTVATDGPAPEDADETVLLLTTMVAASPIRHLAVAAMVDFVWRDAFLSSPTNDRVEREALGLGDVTLLASSPFASHWRGGHLVAAPFALAKLPTGSDDESDDFGRLPQRLQVGTGALDIGAGGLASFTRGDLALHGAASYVLRTEANDFDAGDTARLDPAAHHGVFSGSAGGVRGAAQLAAALEGRVLWSAADRGSLAPVESGGVSVYAAPGVCASIGRHTVELAVEVPRATPDQHVDVIVRGGYRLRVN